MDKLRIQEIIAEGRIRNLSDEQIADAIVRALQQEAKSNGKSKDERQKQVDTASH
ncbi:MAG: hypothetical protein KatS3mg023_3898 [Armatimonadota bacterium]|nr:MAG: hypothetical protein KatS3mg023_3898 [Armatimonadota bacterium]